MSPGLRRSWTQYLVVLGSAILMVPLLDILSENLVATWLGVFVLCVSAVMLFRWRKRLRAAFFLPLVYVVLLGSMRLRVEGGIESAGFSFAVVALVLMCVLGLLADAFWNPYSDDLAEVEHLSQFKE